MSTRMLRFFGPHGGPRDIERTETPVGTPCDHCGESIEADGYGFFVPYIGPETDPRQYLIYHRECFLRTTGGSAGHWRGECGCYGFADYSEVGLSAREAARNAAAAMEAFLRRRKSFDETP